ncbi:SurA N-terminal domain-containing protein [Ferrimonas senticii]|uniref:SurA N-terminal domain-containing protein n=1 Tax=Ferrimonas senticii TaxID=394566 RepID=UPI0004207B93|nr:SurA N-terminal domain-containing protein [Ferrimonas senticii]
MLEKIREGSQGVAAKIILSLVILSFALTGVYSYLGTNTGQVAAIVNGEEINRYDLDTAFQNEQNRLRNQMGEMFDTLLADPAYMDNLRQTVLDRIVAERLLDQKVREMGLRVSDAQIKQALREMPEFQVDGKFDNDRYQLVLRQSNLTGAQLGDIMRGDMARQQLLVGLLGSEFATEAQAKSLAELQQQTRDVRVLMVKAADYASDLNIDSAAVESYYNANPLQFAQAEQVQLEYVELNVADISGDIDVAEEDARAYFEANQSLYSMPERRLAAHMLFEGDDAKARAEAALARVNGGEAFADVAKSESDDTFSAENGGELDWMTPGTMGEVFDNALFALPEGGVSEVLETDFGFQIVQAKQVEATTTRPFAEVQQEINAVLATDVAQQEFYALQQQLADISFEVPDSLQETADAIGAQVKLSPWFDRMSAPAPLNNPRLLAEAFSDPVLLDGMNSEVVEVGNNHLIVVRAKGHKAAGTKPLAEVTGQIEQLLKQQQASELAQQQADKLMADWQAGSVPAALIEAKAINRMGDGKLDNQLVAELFKLAPATTGSAFSTIKLANGDIAVVALDAVTTPTELQGLEMLRGQLSQQSGQLNYLAFVDALKADAEVVYPVVDAESQQ